MAYDLASPRCDAGEETRWVFFLASFRCVLNMQNGPFDYKVSQTRQASDEVVFTAERPNISFVMWNEEGFAKLSEIVFQWVGSKKSD